MYDKNKQIEVLYALVDRKGNYSKVAGTSICSMLENIVGNVRIHVFYDGSIDERNKANFDNMVKGYRQEIFFYNVRELMPKVWQEAEHIFPKAIQDERFTEATLYRLLAPQLLPDNIKKVIYIDADTIVNMDISELWQEKIGDSGLAAVREADMLAYYGVKGEGEALDVLSRRMEDKGVSLATYFNAGVLLLDLERLRSKGNLLLSGFRILAEHPEESRFYDQSILNYYFAANLTPLPRKYNIMMNWDKEFGKPKVVQGIYHYLGFHLGLDKDEPRDVLYFKYFLKTPWCTPEFLCQFFDSFVQLFKSYYMPRAVEQTLMLRRIAAVLAHKSLVIAATEEFMPQVLAMVEQPDQLAGDNVFVCNKGLSLTENIRLCSLGNNNNIKLNLNFDVETHLYMFFVPDYTRISNILSSAGLKEGEDFLDGTSLLDSKSWLDLEIKPQIVFEKL